VLWRAWDLLCQDIAIMTDAPKRRSGCMIALYSLFALGLFILVFGGLAGYVALKSPEGRKAVEAVKQSIGWIVEAQRAPGTAELREAGCETAFVTSLGAATEAFKDFMPEQARKELEDGEAARRLDQVMLICAVGRLTASPPECSELARIYATSIEFPPESYLVRVQRQGRNDAICQGLYDSEGRFLENIDDEDAPW